MTPANFLKTSQDSVVRGVSNDFFLHYSETSIINIFNQHVL